ncbi:fimbrial chaperone [Escherichia coli]|uniref:fimbrial chaperone n=1 Tax=Escherichia coli TaxID=562 RepID=UPI0038B3B119
MNKVLKWGMLSLVSFVLSGQAMAAFTLNGTRFIYTEGKKNISVEVTNNSVDTYGGQVWVDNVSQGSGVYMVPTPPFFRLDPKQTQIVRVMNPDSSSLPKDRESLFFLNVQELPPKPKDDGNHLAIAMNTRVKLIYRPRSLLSGRKGAEKQIQVVQHDGETYLKNPTPYWFAVTEVKVNGKAIPLNDDLSQKLATMAPFGETGIKLPAAPRNVEVKAINDWGGVDSYTLKG